MSATRFAVCFLVLVFSASTVLAELPGDWLAKWRQPTASERPLQIIHGYFGVNKDKWSHPYIPFDHFHERGIEGGMRFFAEDCGLGGVVLNVSSFEYLRNEEEWKHCVDAVRAAKKNGLRVWIYDEDRYPSLAAGGLTLQGHPELECLELVYDPGAAEPFQVRPSFEFTHASNNFAYIRRYPNIMNPAAAARFLELTHEAYKKRLGPDLMTAVEAFFTDEPSTNVLNTGLLSERVRSFGRVIDEPDPDKKNK